MRKLLILALIAVAALVVMGTHYSGGESSDEWGPLSGSVNVLVYQWADVTFKADAPDFEILDCGVTYDGTIAYLSVDSNYTFGIEAVASVKDPYGVDISEDIAASCSVLLFWWDTVNDGASDTTEEPYWDVKNDSKGHYTGLGGPGQVVSGDIYLEINVSDPDLLAGKYTLSFDIYIKPEVTF